MATLATLSTKVHIMLQLYHRIPHIIGSKAGPDDLILDPSTQHTLLHSEVRVYEKLDGVAVAVGRIGKQRLSWTLRPTWQDALDGTLARGLSLYMQQREQALRALLPPNAILYGEWLWHTISLSYDALPDFFFCYDLQTPDGSLLPLDTLQAQCAHLGLSCITPLWQGTPKTLESIQQFVGTSQYGDTLMEGLIIQQANTPTRPLYAKWVEAHYESTDPADLTGQRNTLTPHAAQQLWPPPTPDTAPPDAAAPKGHP